MLRAGAFKSSSTLCKSRLNLPESLMRNVTSLFAPRQPSLFHCQLPRRIYGFKSSLIRHIHYKRDYYSYDCGKFSGSSTIRSPGAVEREPSTATNESGWNLSLLYLLSPLVLFALYATESDELWDADEVHLLCLCRLLPHNLRNTTHV